MSIPGRLSTAEIQGGALGYGCWEINPTGCSLLRFFRVEGPWDFWEANTEGLEQLVGDCPECFLKTVADIFLSQGASHPAGWSSRVDPISTARE